jgi:NhaA family Na+:H+ antiporter
VGVVAGIGFTVSLFVSELAFGSTRSLADAARMGVLVSSILGGAAGLMILRTAGSDAGRRPGR